jgi:superfamily II DNA/RNA helicase
MGFREHLETIMKYIPRVQTLMFSATMTRGIVALADMCTTEPEKLLLQGVSAHR